MINKEKRGRSMVRATVWVAIVTAGSCGPKPPAFRPAGLPDQAFRVEWMSHAVPARMGAGSSVPVSVTFKNLGPVPWLDPASTGNTPPHHGAVRLGYRWWWPRSPLPVAGSSARADLQRPLPPGESATLTLLVTAPAAAGSYTLQFDLVQEFVSWFEAKGAAQLVVPVRVE